MVGFEMRILMRRSPRLMAETQADDNQDLHCEQVFQHALNMPKAMKFMC